MSVPALAAVLFDYGHTLIHFEENPHARLSDAYQRINQLLRKELAREIPEAESLIRDISMVVDAEIQADYQAGRPEGEYLESAAHLLSAPPKTLYA